MQKKYSQAALAFAEFNAKYPDDIRYEQISLLIAEATVEYALKTSYVKFLYKHLIQLITHQTNLLRELIS